MIILGKPQQHFATWRVILFRLTACIMFSQFILVAHRFCIFWCIHHMYSATIAQSSSKYCRHYYLFRSLFPIECFLVSLYCSAHAYALTMRLYNLVITLFSVVFGPHIELLTQNDYYRDLLVYEYSHLELFYKLGSANVRASY